MPPVFFASPDEFRDWLDAHHATATELWVGFHKVHTGTPSLTWPQAVDEALCVGWIDGIRKSLGDDAYTIRFTPRTPTSVWSAVNVRRVAELTAAGRMRPAGLAAFARRDAAKSAAYSYENRPEALDPADERALRTDPAAWAFFASQAPHYRRACAHWLASAKKPETRARRLATLLAHSARGERIPQFLSPAPKRRPGS